MSFPADQVYTIDRIIERKQSDGKHISDINTYQDFALLQLNRSVPNKKSLILDRSGDFLAEGNKVFLMGYPMGMSVKITDPNDSQIYKLGKNIFTTDLDSFGGNSGGPVFDSYTKRIIGVIVTGNKNEIIYTLNKDLKLSFGFGEYVFS